MLGIVAEGEADDLVLARLGRLEVGGGGIEGLDMDANVVLVRGIAMSNGLVGGELGGVEEAGDVAGEVRDDVARLDAATLEALDGGKLEGRGSEVTDGDCSGHVGRRGEKRRECEA